MKDVISKRNKPGSRLPTKFAINKDDVTSEIGIPNEFNKFFTKIGPELARKVSTTSRIFESFLNKIGTTKPADPISSKSPDRYQTLLSEYYQKLL